jgi:hypothetical protein
MRVRLRSTLTAFFVLLLLSVSCVSPACAASCNLMGLSSLSRLKTGQRVQADTAAPAGMSASCHGMAMSEAGTETSGPMLTQGDCCSHDRYGQDQMSAIPSEIYQVEQTQPALEGVYAFVHSETQILLPAELASHSPPLSPPLFNAILRI